MPYWGCLAVFSKRLPSDINAFFTRADVEETDTVDNTEDVALSRSFQKMELDGRDVKN